MLEKRMNDLSKSVTILVKDVNMIHNEIEILANSQDALMQKISSVEEGVACLSKSFPDSSDTSVGGSEHNQISGGRKEADVSYNDNAGHRRTSAPDGSIHDETIHAVVRNIAAGFWDALLENNLDTAKTFATMASGKNLTINKNIDDSSNHVTFGDIVADNDKATIETMLNTQKDGSQISIPLQTILVKEKNQWKVDADLTMMSVFGGAMGEVIEGIGEAVKNSGEGMGRSLAEGMSKELEDMANGKENMGQQGATPAP
ncbi:MAG: hypothetical protein HKUEN01_21010 [Candidatus Kuenenia stuttgartiensis]|nr:MAG: hypothetical protein HKUEN01_21010 [Candidatus Kuenenia stuttgartiensis]